MRHCNAKCRRMAATQPVLRGERGRLRKISLALLDLDLLLGHFKETIESGRAPRFNIGSERVRDWLLDIQEVLEDTAHHACIERDGHKNDAWPGSELREKLAKCRNKLKEIESLLSK